MEVIPLQSGSSGNCIYVESRDVRLLFDAGISGRQAELRLQQFGKDIRQVDALIISHDHSDHVRSIGVFHRKYDLPIYISRPTLRVVQRGTKHGRLGRFRFFDSGETFSIGPLTIETLQTPHDAADGVAFVIDDGEKRFGLWTDLGHVFGSLHEFMPTLDAILLESNYDPQMLIDSRYPDFLKSRIAGSRGHLSNEDAAELLQSASSDLQWAYLGHLSEENNQPETAVGTHRRLLGENLTIRVADRYAVSEPMRIETPAVRKTPPHRMVQQRLFS